KWFAHRVQKPHQKMNHNLILGGKFGIGKDSLVAPLKHAVGYSNFKEIYPHEVFGTFNPYVKAVVLHVSEARDLGDHGKYDRFQFFERMKGITTTPPDTIGVNEKFTKQYYVFKLVSVIFTANRMDSFYLPPKDRRHYVAWSNLDEGHEGEEFWLK